MQEVTLALVHIAEEGPGTQTIQAVRPLVSACSLGVNDGSQEAMDWPNPGFCIRYRRRCHNRRRCCTLGQWRVLGQQ